MASIDQPGDSVKGKRRYDATGRRQQASATREAILEAASQAFLRNGYAGTKLPDVAAEVEVSVDTIYKTFNGKAGLLEAIVHRGLAGEGPVHAETRSDELQATETDPRKIIRGWGKFTTEVAPRTAPIVLLIRDAAAIDSRLADLLAELDAQRMGRMTDNARHLAEGGHLRAGITVKAAADILWTYTAPYLYESLVLKRRWPVEQYGDLIAEALIAALLPPERS